jgi:hypothetical protein
MGVYECALSTNAVGRGIKVSLLKPNPIHSESCLHIRNCLYKVFQNSVCLSACIVLLSLKDFFGQNGDSIASEDGNRLVNEIYRKAREESGEQEREILSK